MPAGSFRHGGRTGRGRRREEPFVCKRAIFPVRLFGLSPSLIALLKALREAASQSDEQGRPVLGDWLRAHTPVANADYYVCGPKPFLRAFVGELSLSGVPSERIHFEFFGPADELIAA